MTAGTLNTLHNLHFYLDTMRRIREAIVFSTLEELRQDYRRIFPASADPADSDPFASIMHDGVHNAVLAMGTPPGPGVNPYVQLIPIALVFAIFYFIILLPTKRRQKKLQEFLDALKVGDRVVTTGGIYGSVTKVDGQTVQLQIADKVRIELSKNAIVGYQGQESLADSQLTTMSNLRWKLITIISRLRRVLRGRRLSDPGDPLRPARAAVAARPAAQAGARPQRRRAPGAARADR